MTKQKTTKKIDVPTTDAPTEIKPLTEEQQQDRAEQIELIITMFPRLAKDKAQSVIRFAAMLCDLAGLLNIDPVEFMVKSISQYKEMDRKVDVEKPDGGDEPSILKGTGSYYCNECGYGYIDEPGLETGMCPKCDSGEIHEETESNE